MTGGTFSAKTNPGGVVLAQPVMGSSRRAVERAIDFHGVEMRRVVREEIARLHSGGIENAFPAPRGECGRAHANLGFGLIGHDGRA
jgi:hypothetical protein